MFDISRDAELKLEHKREERLDKLGENLKKDRDRLSKKFKLAKDATF